MFDFNEFDDFDEMDDYEEAINAGLYYEVVDQYISKNWLSTEEEINDALTLLLEAGANEDFIDKFKQLLDEMDLEEEEDAPYILLMNLIEDATRGGGFEFAAPSYEMVKQFKKYGIPLEKDDFGKWVLDIDFDN